MNELFILLGLRLRSDQLSVELTHETVFVESNQQYIIQQNSHQLSGMLNPYYGNHLAKTNVIWSYQTEFGAQYEKYISSTMYSNINTRNMYLGQQASGIIMNQQLVQNQMINPMSCIIRQPIGSSGNEITTSSSAMSYSRTTNIWDSIKGIFTGNE